MCVGGLNVSQTLRTANGAQAAMKPVAVMMVNCEKRKSCSMVGLENRSTQHSPLEGR